MSGAKKLDIQHVMLEEEAMETEELEMMGN